MPTWGLLLSFGNACTDRRLDRARRRTSGGGFAAWGRTHDLRKGNVSRPCPLACMPALAGQVTATVATHALSARRSPALQHGSCPVDGQPGHCGGGARRKPAQRQLAGGKRQLCRCPDGYVLLRCAVRGLPATAPCNPARLPAFPSPPSSTRALRRPCSPCSITRMASLAAR